MPLIQEIDSEPTQQTPQNLTLSQLDARLKSNLKPGPATQERLENVLDLKACLEDEESGGLSRVSGDETEVESLIAWLSSSVLPDKSLRADDPSAVETSLRLTKDTALASLQCLDILQALSLPIPTPTIHKLLLCAIIYLSRDEWTNDQIRHAATALLSHSETQTSSFIIDYLLQEILRPLFSRSRPSTLTESGRKAMPTSDPPKKTDIEQEKKDRPWKYEAIYSVAVFEWVVDTAPVEIIDKHWNMFIPPLLTLCEDPDTPIRCRGLNILSTFLMKISPSILLRTGLGAVFEDAVTPTLTFLPSITPIEESVLLLPAAYVTLEALGKVRFAKGGEDQDKKLEYLHRIIRNGILAGYDYASQCPSIVQILLIQLSLTVSKLGIHSVIHLKDTLPMIATILSDPFVTISLLFTTLSALEAVIQNGWPRTRAEVHRRRIMLGLGECWNNVNKIDGEECKRVELLKHLKKVTKLFVSVSDNDIRAGEERKAMEMLTRMVAEVR